MLPWWRRPLGQGPIIWPPGVSWLAAWARGLGRLWATFHLRREREAIPSCWEIPFEAVMQVALIPVVYAMGTDSKPAARHPLDTMVH